MKSITSERFLESFCQVWRTDNRERQSLLQEWFEQSKFWTAYMVKGGIEGLEQPFLKRVMTHCGQLVGLTRHEIQHYPEMYTLDFCFVGPPDLLGNEDLSYPATLFAIVEHENGEDIETEMWKLLFWKAPLKVIVCYDFNENDKKKGTRLGRFLEIGSVQTVYVEKAKWRDRKIELLTDMHKRAQAGYPESDDTEYLLIFGNKDRRNIIHWQAWRSVSARPHFEPVESWVC